MNWILCGMFVFLTTGIVYGEPPHPEKTQPPSKGESPSPEKLQQSQEEITQQKFVKDLQQLFDAAKISGFSEDALREMSIERNGTTIRIWDYLQREKSRQLQQEEEERRKQNKHYLTVHDITDELNENEPEQLKQLRSKLVFGGTKE